jgi:hypothetical protein
MANQKTVQVYLQNDELKFTYFTEGPLPQVGQFFEYEFLPIGDLEGVLSPEALQERKKLKEAFGGDNEWVVDAVVYSLTERVVVLDGVVVTDGMARSNFSEVWRIHLKLVSPSDGKGQR